MAEGTGQQHKNLTIDFPPISLTCADIASQLRVTAEKLKVPVALIDFDIVAIYTKVRFYQDEPWQDADKTLISEIKRDQYMLNSDFSIMQSYDIMIKPYRKDESFLLDTVFGANKTFSKAVCTIKKSSIISPMQRLGVKILNDINKKKLKLGMMVNVFDDEMIVGVTKLVKLIEGGGQLQEDMKIVVCSCKEPILPQDDKLIFHYQEKAKEDAVDEYGRVDYSKRGFAIPVAKDETFIEYIKPKPGTPGRNCKGEYVEPSMPKAFNEPKFKIDEDTIYTFEDDNSIHFKATNPGFVENQYNTYRVKEELSLQKIDFKNTGSIESDKSMGLSLSVKTTDLSEDSISAGMRVECAKLDITGIVGSGAHVITKRAHIDGTTHQTSTIEADDAYIKLHKGTLIAKNVKIDTLEGGVVKAEKVHIAKMLGGEVEAKEVEIDFCYSNGSVTASDSIRIKQVYGESNRFTIDPEMFGQLAEIISTIKGKLLKVGIELRELERAYEQKSNYVNENIPAVRQIKQKIIELQKLGTQPNMSLIGRVKEFQIKVEEVKTIVGSLNARREQKTQLESELDVVQNGLFRAKIVHEGLFTGMNTVKFVTIVPKKSITYTPKAYEKSFTLKEGAEEGEFYIHASPEVL